MRIDPAQNAVAITANDTVDLTRPTRGLYVGTAVNLAVQLKGTGNANVVFPNVPAGTVLPIEATRVLSTGTGAGNLVAMW